MYVSDQEAAQLLALAAEHGGITVPRLLIESTLAPRGVPSFDRREVLAELFAIRRQLSGVANNVNQLARLAHVEGIPNSDEVNAALGLLRVMAGPGGRLDAAIDRLAMPRGRRVA